jgi:hypothetical protein
MRTFLYLIKQDFSLKNDGIANLHFFQPGILKNEEKPIKLTYNIG